MPKLWIIKTWIVKSIRLSTIYTFTKRMHNIDWIRAIEIEFNARKF
jgi:hypothetical protein